MPSRTIQGLELHNWQDVWHTSDGRFEISAEGSTTSRCIQPHMVKNGMMCPGDQNHIHTVWWVWDSIERTYPLGKKSFDTLREATVALDAHLTWRGR